MRCFPTFVTCGWCNPLPTVPLKTQRSCQSPTGWICPKLIPQHESFYRDPCLNSSKTWLKRTFPGEIFAGYGLVGHIETVCVLILRQILLERHAIWWSDFTRNESQRRIALLWNNVTIAAINRSIDSTKCRLEILWDLGLGLPMTGLSIIALTIA